MNLLRLLIDWLETRSWASAYLKRQQRSEPRAYASVGRFRESSQLDGHDERWDRFERGLRNDPDAWKRQAQLAQAESEEDQKARLLRAAGSAGNVAWLGDTPEEARNYLCCLRYQQMGELCPVHPRPILDESGFSSGAAKETK